MADPAAGSVREANRYRPPAITGLTDLLDQQVRDRPDARALVVPQGSDTGVLSGPRRVGRRRGGPAGQHRAAARRCGRPDLCQHRRVRRGAPGGGAGGAGGRSAGPGASPATNVRPARRAWGAGDPRRSIRGRAVRCAVRVPIWQLRVDVSVGGIATVTLETRAGAVRSVRRAGPSSRTTTPWSCSPRGPPTGRRWSR